MGERTDEAEVLRALHREVAAVREGPTLAAGLVHAGLVVLAVAAWRAGLTVALPPLWVALAWSSHAALVRLHEAVHRMLSPSRVRNELHGILIGTLAWTPMSVYRHVHARHHAYLGRPADPEFRPYSLTAAPLWLRRGYAWTELIAGAVFTPALYTWRTLAAWSELRPGVRRRLLSELLVLLAFWAALVQLVTVHGWWPEFAVAHLVPAWLAGVLQTVRKFTEHLGMHGDSIPSMTRWVEHRRWPGRILSRSQLFVDHHGTHHRWPRIPWFALPNATPLARRDVGPPFPAYLPAVRDALRHLRDPRVGPQWRMPR
jgi:fatty acid desaturase